MTKQEQKEYLQKFVASQDTQAGLSLTLLLVDSENTHQRN